MTTPPLGRDIQPAETDLAAVPTEDELAVLEEAGYDRHMVEYADFSGQSLLAALRVGYELGKRDATR